MEKKDKNETEKQKELFHLLHNKIVCNSVTF